MSTPDMRAGDADRDHVVERLREAYAEGRLDNDELNERIESAHEAKTLGELAPLTADLPVATASADVARDGESPARDVSGRGKQDKDMRAAWAAWLGVGILMNVIWFGTWVAGSGSPTYYWPIWVIGPWGAAMFIAQLTRWFTR